MADTITPPDFLDYSPADIVGMGFEQGLPPERIAQGLMKHRANIEGWGREQNADAPDKYFKGAIQLDKDIETQLGQVRLSAERAALSQALPDPASQQKLISQLEAGGYDPDAVDADLKPALDNVLKVRGSDAFQMPARTYGGAVKVGDTTLARYAMREAGDGMMDVSLAFDDDSTDLVRVPKVTREDVKAEFARRRDAVEAAAKEAKQMAGGSFLDPLGETFGRTQKEGNLNKAKADLAALIDGRESYLQGERVRDALKDEKFRGRAGQYAGWTEFMKGAADATITSGALVSRLAGRDDWITELAQGQDALETAFPGSTRRKLEGGVVNESITGAQRALGMMAPMIAGGAATRGLTAAVGAEAELARQAAGRLGVAGAGMSAAAAGGAYLDTQREINAAEAAGDQARADRIRFGRDAHALLTGVAEGAIERLGAAQAFNVGKGAKGLLKDFVSEGVEEPLTGLAQRGLVDPITIDRQQNITDPLATEALTGLLAAGPLVGGGAAMNRLTGNGNASPAPNTQPPPPTPGTPPSAITPLVNIARQAGAQDRVRLTPEEATAGLADPGTIEGDLLTDARFRPPFQAQPPGPLDPGRFGNVTEGLDTLPTNDLTQPDVTAAMPQMGGPVSYEGYQGRLDRDNEGRLVVDTGDQLIEVADTRGLTRLPNQPTAPQAQPTATEQAPAMQTPSGINPAPAGTGFVAAPGDQVALVDELGKVYVPQNRRLDRTVRVAPDGAVEVLVQRVDQPGRILRLRGAQAQQAQTALLDAVIAQESQARGIRPPTPGTVSRQGSALPFEEIVAMAAAAIRNGLTNFSAWATAMVRRFGEAVRAYLKSAWQSAKKNSQVGAIDIGGNVTRMASDSGAAQNTEPSLGGLSEAIRRLNEIKAESPTWDDFRRRVRQSHLTDLSNPLDHVFGRALAGFKDEPKTDIQQLLDEQSGYLDDIKYTDREIYAAITARKPTVKIFRAVPETVTGKIRPGDYVALTRRYAQMHLESVLESQQGIKGKILVEEVPKRDVIWGEADWQEWAYSPREWRDAIPSLEEFYETDTSASSGTGFTNTQIVATRPDGSTVIFSELVNLAEQGIRAGLTLAQWTAAMVQRFGAAVRAYLKSAWQSAKKNSQVGALDIGGNVTRMASDDGAAQNTELSTGGLTESGETILYNAIMSDADPGNRFSDRVSIQRPGSRIAGFFLGGSPQAVTGYGNTIKKLAVKIQNPIRLNQENYTPQEFSDEIFQKTGIRPKVTGELHNDTNFREPVYTFFSPGMAANEFDSRALARTFAKAGIDAVQMLDDSAYDGPTQTDRVYTSWIPYPLAENIRVIEKVSPKSSRAEAGAGFTNTTVVARRPDGSTVIFAELVGMATQAVQAGVNLARWTADMVRQFGAGVRRYLQGAWQAANKTSRQGFLHPGDLPSVITTRLGLQQNAPFRVKQLGARDLFLGSTLPANMVPLVARSENEVKAVEQTAAQLARDLQAAETAAVNRRGLPLDRLHGHVTDFLNGVPVAGAILSAMDPVTYDRARRMRNFIDDLTATVAASLPAGTMRDTLVNNTGSWLRRSYAAFDPNSGWNFENVMTAARKGKDVGGRPALDILRKGAAYLSAQNGYPASMRTAQGLPVAGSELESDMRDLMDRDQYERALTGQPGTSKNVTSLMRRKDIPPEIRELMGEETNVYKRFTASASFQAQFIRRHHAQVAMRQVGLASGLFSMNRGGVFTQQIPADGPRWSGLEGVWTTPELWEALQLSTGVAAAGTDIAGYVGRFLRYTSSKAKLNRVALNPDSWMVNGLGGAAMMLMNGDWFSGRVAARLMESVRLMKSGRARSGDVVNAAQDTLKDIQRDLIARLTAEGVFGAGVSVADIEASLPRHTLQWIETDLMRDRVAGTVEGAIIGQGMGRGFGTEVRVVGGMVGGALGGMAGAKRIRTAQNAIADLALTKPDMLFRLTGFLTNYEAALGAGLAPDAAFNEASTRTLNTFPNYAAVPAFLRSLSQFGAINSFVSFMFEMHRNTAWSMRYMAQDLAAPSMAQKRRGLQRLAGAGAVGALMAGGLPALISLLFGGGDDKDKVGMDDERNNIFTRWFAAPWERDAILAFTKFDKEGVSYLNTSYLLPQQILGELAMAARNGDNPTDAAARIAVRLQTQFAGDSVNLTPLMQAYTNTDGRGRPVTVRSGIEGAWERTDHALKVIAEPGFVEKVNKLIYAYRDAERRGRTFSVEQEFRRVIGLRETTRTWSDLTLGRYKEFDSQIGRIREGANRTLGENLPGAKATALERANRELAEIRTELQRFEKEAVKLGVPFGILQRAKKDVGLSNIRNVMVDPIKRNRVKSIGTR